MIEKILAFPKEEGIFMILLKRFFLIVFIVALIVTGLTVSLPAQSRHDESSYKKQGIVYDQFKRVVNDPRGGKANYLWNKPGIAITTKGNIKAQSVSFSAFPEQALKSDTQPLDSAAASSGGYLPFEQKHVFGIFGSGIGLSGIVTADIDNDGAVEIVMGGSTSTFGLDNFWYILEYDAVSHTYRMQWISGPLSAGISSIAAFDIDNDGIFTIFIGLSNGDVHIVNGSTLKEIGIIDSPGGQINRIRYADADNDSIKELVFCDSTKLFIYNATSLALERQLAYGASDFAVGNVDGDSANEIVLANGLVLEFNGISTTVEWDYPGGDFGYLVALSDIDGDGMEEVIAASSWYYVTAFDIDIQSPKWQIPTDIDVDALLVTDVDNDGIDEVLYGDGQWGAIHCYNAVTQTEKWSIDNPEHGVTNIAVFDTDGDGDLEILWGAGASSTGEDHLYIHGIPTKALEWQSQHLDGPFHALDVGDVDADGQNEIVFASFSSNSGYDDGIISIYDAATYELKWQSTSYMFGRYAWTGIHDLKIADVDDDGEQEIVVATDRLYDGAIYIINGTTHVMEKSYFYDEGAPIYSLAIADVDNDGHTEIIAGGGREHTGAPGVYVYIINGSTGAVEWKSISLGAYWSEVYALEVDDVDGDGVPEIVAINSSIFIIDGISHQQWQSTLTGCYGLDLADIDGDNRKEVIVGTSSGRIIALDGQSHAEELNALVSPSSIVGLRAYDIDRRGRVEIIFGSGGRLNTYSIDDSLLLWQSEVLGSTAGDFNAIVVSNIDSDAFTEIVIGTSYSVIVFEGPQSALGTYSILHRDGAICSSEAGWELSTPPYYPGSSYAVDVAYKADGSYTILHTDGALWDSETGWLLTTPPYYPGSAYAKALEVKLESSTGGLWNQPASTYDTYSNQDFETIYNAYDIFIADDFTISEPWGITTIYVPGNTFNPGTSLMNANSLHWQLYADAGGVPAGNPYGGSPPVWSLSLPPSDSQVTLSTGGGGYLSDVTLNLSTPVNLPAGTYWLVFYPQLDADAWGQYGRHSSNTTNGHTAKVINPGGGFGFPTTWTDVTASTTWGGAEPPLTQQDFAFRIESMAGAQLTNVILHRDGALWSSATGWTMTIPPYYPGTDYARALQLRADASYAILHKDGAVYNSASGWVMDAFYAGVDWAVDMKLEGTGYVLLHRDGALWSTAAGWTLTTPPYYPGSDYARALEIVGGSYVILHKDGAIYDSIVGWNLDTPPYYPGSNYAVDLEVR